MKKPQASITRVPGPEKEPDLSEAQTQVLRFIVKLAYQPHHRARAHASILMAWNRDPDFDLVYPVVECYWMAAIGYFEREKNFNPERDQDRIVEYVIDRLAKRFPEVSGY